MKIEASYKSSIGRQPAVPAISMHSTHIQSFLLIGVISSRLQTILLYWGAYIINGIILPYSLILERHG